jgi:archaemetzincin
MMERPPYERKKRTIGVVAIGDVPELALKVIAAHIVGHLKLPAEILPPVDPPADAFDGVRCQYDAGKILKYLESVPHADVDKIIGVLEGDLFVPTFTHVFGEARQSGMHALVSLFRLGRERASGHPSSSLLFERAAKVALHELGHLFNLTHCEYTNCLMYYSGGLEDLDSSPLYFCRYCHTYFRDAIAHR